jgi:hypothetical protein
MESSHWRFFGFMKSRSQSENGSISFYSLALFQAMFCVTLAKHQNQRHRIKHIHSRIFISNFCSLSEKPRGVTMKLMNKLKSIIVVAAIFVSALPLLAQQKRVSPHETIGAVIDGNRVTIVYGRPYTKKPGTSENRKIWGGLVPYGKVWRMGADEATLLITQNPIVFGEATVPAGAFTLWTLPNEDGTAKLIINKQIGQWGEGATVYDEKDDVARINLKKEVLDAPVDQLTMAIEKDPAGGGVLKMSWENAQFSAPFTVQK